MCLCVYFVKINTERIKFRWQNDWNWCTNNFDYWRQKLRAADSIEMRGIEQQITMTQDQGLLVAVVSPKESGFSHEAHSGLHELIWLRQRECTQCLLFLRGSSRVPEYFPTIFLVSQYLGIVLMLKRSTNLSSRCIFKIPNVLCHAPR